MDLQRSKLDIIRRASSQRHNNLSIQQANNKSLASFLFSNDQLDKSAKKIKLKLCAFLAEHYLSISLCEPMLLLSRDLFPNEDALQRVCLGNREHQKLFVRYLVSICYRICVKF